MEPFQGHFPSDAPSHRPSLIPLTSLGFPSPYGYDRRGVSMPSPPSIHGDSLEARTELTDLATRHVLGHPTDGWLATYKVQKNPFGTPKRFEGPHERVRNDDFVDREKSLRKSRAKCHAKR